MDLSQLSNVELMQLNQLTLDELERREVISDLPPRLDTTLS